MLVRSMEQEFSLPFQKVLRGVLSQMKYVFQSRSSPQEAAVIIHCVHLGFRHLMLDI